MCVEEKDNYRSIVKRTEKNKQNKTIVYFTELGCGKLKLMVLQEKYKISNRSVTSSMIKFLLSFIIIRDSEEETRKTNGQT